MEDEAQHGTSRRRFLAAAAATGVTAVAGVTLGSQLGRDDGRPSSAAASSTSTTTAKNPGDAFVDVGTTNTRLASGGGGDPFVSVVDPEGEPRPGAGGIKDVTMRMSAGHFLAGKAIKELVVRTLNGGTDTLTGGISWYGSSGNRIRRGFEQARLSSFEVENLDAASREVLHVELGWTPAKTSIERVSSATVPADTTVQSVTSGSFRVEVDGLATTRVSKVGGLKLVRSATTGTFRPRALTMSVAEVDIAGWEQWLSDTVTKGPVEKAGRVKILNAALSATLLTVELAGLTISRVELAPFETTTDTIRRATVHLLCRKATLL